MTLNCKHCPYQAKSLDINRDSALKEVSDKITRHVVATHRVEHQRALQLLAKLNVGLIWYIVMTGFCNLEENEIKKVDPYIKEQLEKVEGEIAKLIGFEPEEEGAKESLIEKP